MNDKILFVDDEVNILDSMRRQLRKRFQIVTAISGREALDKLKSEGPFAVVVSDMRMPEMDGIELLKTVKAMYPETVRLMLTGNADQETATEAVNKGQIFRFLNKPCPIPTLVTSLALALHQYQLITAEKELLDETLKGSIKVLSELLSFTNPTAFSSGVRIRSKVIQIAEQLSLDLLWHLEIAALLSQIGCVTLPGEILKKVFASIELSPEEFEMFNNHPKIGATLLENIPRMEKVAYIIGNQLKPYSKFSADEGDPDQNLAAQILKAVFDYDLLLFQGIDHNEALRRLSRPKADYNPQVLEKLKHIRVNDSAREISSLRIQDLTVGMVIEENIMARNGMLLAPKGQVITWPVLQGLLNFSRQVGVVEPVRVSVMQ